MDDTQIESQSDIRQDPLVQHGRKRGIQFLILVALFNTTAIIGLVVVLVRQSDSDSDKSPDASLSWNERPEHEPSRIIGGSPSYQNKFPYYVDTSACGGALIAPRVVLSAAHCGASGYGADGNKVIVNGARRGDVGADGKLVSWSRWMPHPGYDENELGLINDFSLYLLDEPVTGQSVSLSLNPNSCFPADGTPVVAIGTGTQNQGSQLVEQALLLQDVVIPVVNTEECKDFYGSSFDTDVMMCAGATGKGICYGDSGGPLVVRTDGNRDILVGVTSMLGNLKCSKFHEYDNIFARSSGAFHWIKSVVCDQWGEQADFCVANPALPCFDSPGWTDPNGYNCGAYSDTEAQGTPICEYHKGILGTGGLTPIQACCVCNYVGGEEGGNTNPSTTLAACFNSPGWTDPNGYDCAAYKGTEAQGTRICEYHKEIPGTGGLTPVEACVVCNYVTGGDGSIQNPPGNPPPPPEPCVDAPGWTDPNGYNCAAYADTEAQGTPICEYHKEIAGAGGLTPVQACCACK